MPYILVSSPSQKHLDRTEQINKAVKTQLSSATWAEIKASFLALAEPNSKNVITGDFLILDQQALQDRTVVIIEKGAEWAVREDDGVREKTVVWKKYRVPYEKAFAVQCGIEGFCGMDLAEKYFVEEVEREAPVEDEEESY